MKIGIENEKLNVNTVNTQQFKEMVLKLMKKRILKISKGKFPFSCELIMDPSPLN